MNKLFCILSIGVALVSCGASADYIEGGGCVRLLSANPVDTRTVLTDGGSSGISARWLGGDLLSAFNLTKPSGHDEFMIAQSTAQSSSFKGYVMCDNSDRIVLFYPAYNKQSVVNYSERGEFQLSLLGQKGTLDDISRRYDFCYGIATVTSADDFYATASFGSFVNLMSVYKLIFQKADGTSISDVVSLTLSSDALCPTKNFDVENGTFTNAVDRTDLPLIFPVPKSVVYLAMFPADDIEYSVDIETSDGNVYTATVPAHSVKAAGFYNMTITTNE